MHYLVFAPLGAPARNPMILGAIVVPECFSPNDAMVDRAESIGLDIFIMTGPEGAVPTFLMQKGEEIMERLTLMRQASLN